MTKFYDALETRNTQEREAALLAALPGQVAHAQRHAPALWPDPCRCRCRWHHHAGCAGATCR